eukprot:PITA_07252
MRNNLNMLELIRHNLLEVEDEVDDQEVDLAGENPSSSPSFSFSPTTLLSGSWDYKQDTAATTTTEGSWKNYSSRSTSKVNENEFTLVQDCFSSSSPSVYIVIRGAEEFEVVKHESHGEENGEMKQIRRARPYRGVSTVEEAALAYDRATFKIRGARALFNFPLTFTSDAENGSAIGQITQKRKSGNKGVEK